MRPISPHAGSEPVRMGSKLRAARQSRGMTLAQLAAGTNLSKGYLSRIENDATSPSVATLQAICEVLSITIGSLFETPEMALVPFEDAPRINLGGIGAIEHLVTPRRQAEVQMIHSQISADGGGGDELYTINCRVEVVHVIEGSIELRFTSRTVTLGAGDTLTFPGNEPHTWHCENDTRVLWTLIPAPWSTPS